MNYRVFKWLGRRGLQRRKLRGSLLHRIVGERLFARDLWVFTRKGVVRGWIIGCLAGGSPFLGLQMLFAFPMVIWLRANAFIVLALILATNPITLPAYFAFCYTIGLFLTGEKLRVSPEVMAEMTAWEIFKSGAWAIIIGSLVVSILAATVGAVLLQLFFKEKIRLPRIKIPHLPHKSVTESTQTNDKKPPTEQPRNHSKSVL